MWKTRALLAAVVSVLSGVGASSGCTPEASPQVPVAGTSSVSAPDPRRPVATAKCDANGDKPWGCDWDSGKVCVKGACLDACPTGTEVFGIGQCMQRCTFDTECETSEICSYISPAYTFCVPRPPPVVCPKGQIALKTGTCWTPCDSDAVCKKLDPGLCCVSDPNAPVQICMSKGCMP